MTNQGLQSASTLASLNTIDVAGTPVFVNKAENALFQQSVLASLEADAITNLFLELAAGVLGGALIVSLAIFVLLLQRWTKRSKAVSKPQRQELIDTPDFGPLTRHEARELATRVDQLERIVKAARDPGRQDELKHLIRAEIEAYLDSTRKQSSAENKPTGHSALLDQQSKGDDAESDPVEIITRLSDIGAQGSAVMHDPLQLSRFAKSHDAVFLQLTEEGRLKRLDRKTAPRMALWFFAIEDQISGLWAIFLGPQMRNMSESIAANPDQFIARANHWFEISKHGGKPHIAQPALVRFTEAGDGVELAHRGTLFI